MMTEFHFWVNYPFKVISEETAKDDTLQTLIKTIREGWATNKEMYQASSLLLIPGLN